MDKLGERINRYRTARGLSQLELSELLDVSRQSISKWETDVAVPELSKPVKMAEIFEISLDELVLGKEPEWEADEKKQDPPTPIPEPAPAKSKKGNSAIKNAMGIVFLVIGFLFGVFCIFYGDTTAAIMMFLPCSISAFFCLKQFRLAALWCVETWFAFFSWFLYFGTSASWNLIFSPTIYAPKANRLMPLVSWTLFAFLVGLIVLTVYSYRKHEFLFSKAVRKVLAVGTATALPLKSLARYLFHLFLFHVAADGDKIYYHGLIYQRSEGAISTLEFCIDLLFIILFTACLVPTFYWVLGLVKKKKENK